ncbi:MAG: sugar phosphate isomerase/epimerase [Phycisphaerae bacterium]|nr:sugar phosphate isomerase/epimerase [Phycisphaerae bacterium]
MILLGGPTFCDSGDFDVLAKSHIDWGFRAAYCPPVKPGDSAAIRAARDAFAKHGVVIAEVGAWCNMIGPEDDTRAKNLEYVRGQLALADELGARCCVDYAGTRRPNSDWFFDRANFSREVFDMIVDTARSIIDHVKPTRTKFTLEVMQTSPPDSVDSYLELIRAIDRPAFGVHLDPVNMLYSPRECLHSGKLLADSVERLGPWIASCHAKDIKVSDGLSVHLDECIPGTGLLDYKTFTTALKKLGRDVPLMLEHLRDAEEYRQARDYVAGFVA